ncbi:MAG: thiol reductase thioredoxin [Myxococcales bacterium]|nr:thiol reductase thioredoxin [Myxococcales bacterium]
MSTVEITAANFDQHVERPGILIIDFWAEWCGPCRAFAPVFEAAAARHPDITWGKCNTEAEPVLAGGLQIRSIPTLMVFRDDILLYAQPGLLPAAALDDLVAQVKALDMDEVRRTEAA